jgi:hypothetical protein
VAEGVLPNLIIAGVNKAGTSSLFSYLSQHPEICPSSIKETGYFLPLRYGEGLQPIDEYAKYFTHYRGQKYIMESTPGYFYGGESVARQIQETLTDVKIIVLFRNPIDRLFSFYKSMRSKLKIDQRVSFDEYVSICENMAFSEKNQERNNRFWGIDGGLFENYINDWFGVFEASLRILFFEHLKEHPKQVMKDLCKWLDIDYVVLSSMPHEVENRTIDYRSRIVHSIALFVNSQGERFFRRHPNVKRNIRKLYHSVNEERNSMAMSQSMISRLESIFEPHNRRLASGLVKKGYLNLPDWLQKA